MDIRSAQAVTASTLRSTSALRGWGPPVDSSYDQPISPSDEGEQQRAEALVQDVRKFFAGLGVRPSEGNDDGAQVVFDPTYPNAAYERVMPGNHEYVRIGIDRNTGQSYAGAGDVVAHEWTHRIVDKMTGGTLSSDPFSPDTAVNESLADTFASVYDADDWTIGEDTGRIVRDMAHPERKQQPGSLADASALAKAGAIPAKLVYGLDGRKTIAVEAHALAGIPNKAATLIGDELGRGTMAKIYLQTMREHLRPDEGIPGLAAGTIKSATELFGANSRELQATKDAWEAVGILDLLKTDHAA